MTVRDAIRDALRGASARGEPRRITVVTAPGPVRAVHRVLRATVPGDRVYWDGCADGGWALAGIGTAAQVEAAGPDALRAMREAGAAVLAGLAVIAVRGVDAPPPALIGGAAFDPGGLRDLAWEGFADASFVLPRWVYGRHGDQGFVRVAFAGDERGAPERLLAEFDRVMAALEAPDVAEKTQDLDARVDELSHARWDTLVGDALAAIRGGAVEKLVVARRTRVTVARAFDPVAAVLRAAGTNQDIAGFLVERNGRCFLGATPERLVVLRHGVARVDALAGTAPRDAPDAAEGLLASDKDLREHAVVVRAVTDALTGFVTGALDLPAAPTVRTLRHMHHLWTPVRAAVRSGTHVLDLAAALHPTPAVAGRPRDASVRWIAAHEPAARGWYAGPVGWFDATGEGALVVALRSAVVADREAWIYAGAGIVQGSVAAAEWAETAVKQRVMRTAMGIDP